MAAPATLEEALVVIAEKDAIIAAKESEINELKRRYNPNYDRPLVGDVIKVY